jgi:hypothetical protein
VSGRKYQERTIKILFGRAIAHIRSESPNGPRYDAQPDLASIGIEGVLQTGFAIDR